MSSRSPGELPAFCAPTSWRRSPRATPAALARLRARLLATVALAHAEGDAADGVLGLEARAQGAADEPDRGGEDGKPDVVAHTHPVAQARGEGAVGEHQGG